MTSAVLDRPRGARARPYALRDREHVIDNLNPVGRRDIGAIAGSHQERPGANRLPQLEVAAFVADDDAGPRVEAEIQGSPVRQAWERFAAGAAVLGQVWAHVDPIQFDALDAEERSEAGMDLAQPLEVEVSSAEARLVRHDDQAEAQVAEAPQAFGGAGEQLHRIWVRQVVPLDDERAITNEPRDPTAHAANCWKNANARAYSAGTPISMNGASTRKP